MNSNWNLSKIREELNRGISLPSSWYTDSAILELEWAKIFNRTWQYIGRKELLTKPGDYLTGVCGAIPVVIVAGETGLKGFVNVCRHRRHEVMKGSGNKKSLQCPYHAWNYDLDGNLKSAPRCDQQGIRKENFPLLPVRVETWGPYVFANPDLEASTLSSQLGDLSEVIAASGLELSTLRFKHREEWRSNSNWKAMIENYLECYHCPIQHPRFSKVINVDPDTYRLDKKGVVFRQTAPTRGATNGRMRGAPGKVKEAQYHYLWPNLTLNINPGPSNLTIDLYLPDGTGGSRGFTDTFFGPEVTEEEASWMIAFNNEVGAEDEALTTSVQRGCQAGIPERGLLLGTTEKLLMEFQSMVCEALR